MHRRQLLSRPTQLALVKGESYGACSRPSGESSAPEAAVDMIGGPEQMADLVGRIMQEKLLAAAEAQAQQQMAAEAEAKAAAEAAEQKAAAAVPEPSDVVMTTEDAKE